MMIEQKEVYFLEHTKEWIEIQSPEVCPICKYSIVPEEFYNIGHYPTAAAAFFYKCPHCNEFFFCVYRDVFDAPDPKICSQIAPMKFKAKEFDKYVSNTSPMFIKIYNQALAAETENLDEIAGIGYRKALEFLIKDFLISEYPDDTEKIKSASLGNCINDRIDNPQLQTVAKRAVWLGNDQTHYVQKFEDKDINDLKRLIDLTCHWIAMVLQTREVEEIQPR